MQNSGLLHAAVLGMAKCWYSLIQQFSLLQTATNFPRDLIKININVIACTQYINFMW
jgi:hypothetical protein